MKTAISKYQALCPKCEFPIEVIANFETAKTSYVCKNCGHSDVKLPRKMDSRTYELLDKLQRIRR